MCAGTLLVTCNFPTMMTKIFTVANIFICVFVTVQAAAVSPQDCGERMQSQLRELLATKQTCDSAFFRDCCQVHIQIQQVMNKSLHVLLILR